MNEGDSYIVTFTPDKVVRLYFDSSPNSGAEPISVNADLSGHYILAEGALGAQFDVAKLHSVTVNGKAIPPSQLREFEPRLIASMNQSLAAPIDVLDSQQLILSSTEGGSPFPCKRRGQKVMSALRLETKP